MDETQKPPRELARIESGPRGLQLTSLDEMYRFAQYVCASGLAPKGVDKPEAVLVALQMGAELGLTPMASLQNVAVINGRPSVWGDAQLAVCRGSGLFDEGAFDETLEVNGDQTEATCTVRRIGNAKPVVRTFGVPDAKKAGLWGKAGPWQQYPRRMLQMRARSWALRDAFADILRGFPSAEEVRDYAPRESLPGQAAGGSRTKALVERLAGTATSPEPTEEPPYNPPTEEEQQQAAEDSQVDLAVDEAEAVDQAPDDEQEYLEAYTRVKAATAADLPAIMQSLGDGSHAWMGESEWDQLCELAALTIGERLASCKTLRQVDETLGFLKAGQPSWLSISQSDRIQQQGANQRILLRSGKTRGE